MKYSTRDSQTISQLVKDRVPFTTYGALLGTNDRPFGEGLLNNKEAARYREEYQNIDYVVLSYSTPIAWHSTRYGWHIVNQKFSRTTTRHQTNALYRIHEGDDQALGARIESTDVLTNIFGHQVAVTTWRDSNGYRYETLSEPQTTTFRSVKVIGKAS